MNRSLSWTLEKATAFFLCTSIILVLFATGVEEVLSSGVQMFLISAIVFCLFLFLILCQKKILFFYIQKEHSLFFLVLVLFVISTCKYLLALGDGQGITFFTVYQIPIFALFGFFTYIFFMEYEKYIPGYLFLFSSIESILILIFRNRFMQDLGLYRFMGIYDNPNIQGLFSAITCMFSIYLLTRRYRFRLASIVNLSLSVAAIFLTLSRGSLLAMLFGICVFIFFCLIKVTKKQIVSASVIITAVLLLTVLFIQVLQPNRSDMKQATVISTAAPPKVEQKKKVVEKEVVVQALSQRFSIEDDSSGSVRQNLRLSIWGEYISLMPEYFLAGTDYSLNSRPIIGNIKRDSHNTILYVFFRYGILGLCALLILLFTIIVNFLKKGRINGYQNAAFGCFCTLGLISMLNDLLNTPIFFLVLAFSYMEVQKSEKRYSSSIQAHKSTSSFFIIEQRWS